jgi:hypothetical protein
VMFSRENLTCKGRTRTRTRKLPTRVSYWL